MKEFKFFAAVVVAMIAAMVMNSCSEDSTYLGLETEFKSKSNADSVEISGEDFVLQLDTTVNNLFTVEQKVSFDRTLISGNEVISSMRLEYDLNCSVETNPQPNHYVAEEVLLQDDQAEVSASAIDTTVTNVEEYVDLYSCSRDYYVTFKAGERIKYTAKWQYIEAAGKVMAHAEPYDLAFDSLATIKDTKLSESGDSLVYNTNLYVQVKEKQENKEYTIRTPWNRIYKNGEVPAVLETVLENKGYQAEFQVASLALETKLQEVSGDLVVYKNGTEEVSRDAFLKSINLEALFTQPNRVYVDSEEQLTDVSLTNSSHSADYLTKSENGLFVTSNTSLKYNFKFNEGEAIAANVAYEKLSYEDEDFTYSMIKNVRFNNSEVSENVAASSDELKVVNVTLYFDVEVERKDPIATRTAEEVTTYTVAVPYERAFEMEVATDELVDKRYENVSREIVDANTEKISWTEIEEWSLSGEKSRTISFNLYRHFNEPKLQWIYTANNQYTTVASGSSLVNENSSKNGNWTITTRYMKYVSTANNGVDPFQNVYSYDIQKAVYTDEYYTLSFDYANWNISEAGSSVSATPTREVVDGTEFDVYNYVNNINTVYSVTGDSYNASAKSEAKIAVLPKTIPASWGKILGAAISAVPADDEAVGDYAKKCLIIRTENGAVAVPFSMNATLPEVSSILNGYFVEGNFGTEYNSGYFTTTVNHGSYIVGAWAPAIAEYRSDEYPIVYNSDVNTPVRSLSKYILAMWNWRSGNFTHVVDGYSFSASENGVLTITYNGDTVMQLR